MTLLLLQMSVVLLVTLACGWFARKLGQTLPPQTLPPPPPQTGPSSPA